MIFLLAGLALFFLLIGFSITTKNAKYLLSGYNTMSTEERESFNLEGYLRYFKRFHSWFSASFFLFGIGFLYGINETALAVFISIYPIVAYLYLAVTSGMFYKSKPISSAKIGVAVLVVALVFVIGVLSYGLQEQSIMVQNQTLVIDGMYGETISFETIQSVELLSELPDIQYKSNGFAMGNTKLGHFKLSNGEAVKLFISGNEGQLVQLVTDSNKTIIVLVSNEIYNQLKGIQK